MASAPPASIDASLSTGSERAIFTLLKPITAIVDGAEIEINGMGMRALDVPDLPLLDRHRGQTIALAQHVVAALCDLSLDQVRQLDLEDFTMLAGDALFQVEQVSLAMGLPADFFLEPRGEEDEA